jgi:hypothetical protein
MHTRKLLTLVGAAALFFGLAFAAGHATADTSAGGGTKDRGKTGGKAKPGGACKVSADCDQSSQPQSCVDSKCQIDRPPPPTT